MIEHKTLILIYPNKAYYTLVHLNYIGMIKFEIFDCKGHMVYDLQLSIGCPTRAPLKVTDECLKRIQIFYKELGLIVPERRDFIPKYDQISTNIVVNRDYKGDYDVCASHGYGSNHTPNITLISNLSYEAAIIKAKDIAALCDK